MGESRWIGPYRINSFARENYSDVYVDHTTLWENNIINHRPAKERIMSRCEWSNVSGDYHSSHSTELKDQRWVKHWAKRGAGWSTINFTFFLYTFRIGSGSRVYPTELIWEVMSARWGGRWRTAFPETGVQRQDMRGKSMRLGNVCVCINVLGNRWVFPCLIFS